MVSVNPNPAQGFYFFDPKNMGLPGLHSLPPPNTVAPPPPPVANSVSMSTTDNTTAYSEDPNKKIRKPYTITKSRESWTEQEHDKFLEALQLFDRDWKKIEAFVVSKTVIQIRSHAQKYFSKVQKNGTSEHVPPPRPKRKAAHPYPQKAPKNDDAELAGPAIAHNSCYSSSNESTHSTWSFGETIDRGDHGKPYRVMPDFAQVYSFIGSVFDPTASGHLQKLKQMDPINLETVLLLMRNLSVNLTSPEFEDHGLRVLNLAAPTMTFTLAKQQPLFHQHNKLLMEIDPSIVKLLEEDEDETMHSGAEVEAFQAALNRDIQAYTSTSQAPSHSNTVLSQGNNQTGNQDGKTINLHNQQALQSAQQQKQNLAGMGQEPCGSIPETPQQQPDDVPKQPYHLSIQQKQSQDAGQLTGLVSQTTGMPTSQRNAIPTPVSDSESQCLKLQKVGNQQTTGGKQVSLAVLMPNLLPQLDKDKAMQLRTLFTKLQTSAQQNYPRMPSFTAGISQFTGPHSFAQLQKESSNSPTNSSHASSSVVSVLTDSSYPLVENNAQSSREMDHESDSRTGVLGSQVSSSSSSTLNRGRDCSSIPGQGLSKQQQQHLASYSALDVNTSGSYLKSQPFDSKRRQLTHHQSMGSTHVGESTQALNMMSGAKFQGQNCIIDPTRLQGGSCSHISSNPVHCQVSTSKELKSSPLSSVTYTKQKSVDHGAQLQYKSHLSTPQGLSPTQIVQGNAIPVTSKDKPLEKQLINSGFTTTNNTMPMNSVSPSLSSQVDRNAPSVEERMRGLICNLIRLSKQRADAEKPMHLKLITSGVRQQIIRLNWKAKEEWEKKQVEVEKLQKLDEVGAVCI
ncbi:hypothetical protein REPUB_Repub17cG0154000 [Reevesia pubescens]